ncbi:MAG: winged helix-turn-helix domain-containing tetratricopeptide repeat protein, partial [Candidatus Binatia bacterium]
MSDGQMLRFGPYHLDPQKEQFWCDGQPVRLTPKAFQVLSYLAERPGQLVTKEELFRVVWADTVVGDAALTMCIQEIRKALQDNAREPQYIETVHRRGFRFIGEVVSSQHAVASSQEETEQPADNGSLASSVQSLVSNGQGLESNGQGLASRVQSRDSEIPAFSFSPDEPIEARLQTRDIFVSSSPSRFTRAFVLAAGMLVLVTVLTVRYLSLPISSTQHPAQSTQPALALPDKPSIIVLPFMNMSEDPTQEYFSDGMTEELTSSLSRIRSLFVIARHSAFTYKGKAVKVQDISREMGVRYILEGSVRKAGDQLRITAQLIDGTTGGHVWSERYDRLLRDIFALQDEITQQIVAALRGEIGKAELTRVRRIPTENLTAYDLYLRGLESSFRVASETKKEANVHARQMFEKAIELDPTYAEAYMGLSWTYFYDWFYQSANDRAQALEQAFAIAQRAVALDNSLPGAHQLLGHVYVWKRQYEQAIVEGEQAIVLDPNDAEGYGRLGTIRKSAEDAGREPGGESRQPKAGRGGRGESLLPLKDGDQIQC